MHGHPRRLPHLQYFGSRRSQGSCGDFVVTSPLPFVPSRRSRIEGNRRIAPYRRIRRDNITFWVYILRCADASYYTGHTDNLDHRIGEHHQGKYPGYTSSRLPIKLAWQQECATREEALSAEMQIKKWSRKKKEAMMRGDWNEVSVLGKKQFQKDK